jgi:hypothetical protein
MVKRYICLISFIGILLLQSCSKMDFAEPEPIPIYHLDGDVNKLMFNRPDGVNIVVLGDGFTKEELIENGKYDAKVKEMTDFLFTIEPFKQYKDHFNIYQIYAESQVSGAADTYTPQRTKFDAYFEAISARTLVPGNYEACYLYAEKAVPRAEIGLLVLLVNDDRYAGTGGQIATISTNVSSPILLVHETGHSFAGLADEYIDEAIAEFYPLDALPNLPNVDNTSDLTKVKWAHFLERNCYCPQVGAFEGAYYRTFGIFRPEVNSIMRDVNFLRFNAPSREAIVQTINARMGVPFDRDKFFKDDKKNLPTGSERSVIKLPPLQHDFMDMKKRTLQLHKLRQQPVLQK